LLVAVGKIQMCQNVRLGAWAWMLFVCSKLSGERNRVSGNGFWLYAERVCGALNFQPTTNLQKKSRTAKFALKYPLSLKPVLAAVNFTILLYNI